jgi:hypothetical protein
MSERGYRIFINPVFEGPVPAVRENSADDPDGSPGRLCVFATEREPQVEIVGKMPSTIHHLPSSIPLASLASWR